MLELGLIGLALYLVYRKTAPDAALPPNKRSAKQGTSTATTAQGRALEKRQSDPWNWPIVPDIFQEVPLNPLSRRSWLNLVEPYQEKTRLKAKLMTETDDEDKRDLRQDLRDVQEVIDKLVNDQRKIEQAYLVNYLRPNFSQEEIDFFHQQRKNEIAAGIWPYQETNIVPLKKKPIQRVNVLKPDANLVTTGATMGANRTMNTVDLERDAAREAMPPGRRVTDAGTVYYEYRQNRSDYPGSI